MSSSTGPAHLKILRKALIDAKYDRRSCRVDRDLRCYHVARLLAGEADSLSISAIREMQPLIERDRTAIERWQLVPAYAEQAKALWARMLAEKLSGDAVRLAVQQDPPSESVAARSAAAEEPAGQAPEDPPGPLDRGTRAAHPPREGRAGKIAAQFQAGGSLISVWKQQKPGPGFLCFQKSAFCLASDSGVPICLAPSGVIRYDARPHFSAQSFSRSLPIADQSESRVFRERWASLENGHGP